MNAATGPAIQRVMGIVFAGCVAFVPAHSQPPSPQARPIQSAQSSPRYAQPSIDGSQTPELIPEEIAYTHFFRVLARRPNVPQSIDDARRRAYLKHYFRNGTCGDAKTVQMLTDDQMSRLISIADQATSAIRTIDQHAVNGNAASGALQLSLGASLQAQRQQVVQGALASLPSTIGPDGAERVKRHVLDHVRSRIKIVAKGSAAR